jgi:hypothetical protein
MQGTLYEDELSKFCHRAGEGTNHRGAEGTEGRDKERER